MLFPARGGLLVLAIHAAQAQAATTGELEPFDPKYPSCEMLIDCGAVAETNCTDGTTLCGEKLCKSLSGCQWTLNPPEGKSNCIGGKAPQCMGQLKPWLRKVKDDDGGDCSCDYDNVCLEQVDCHWMGVLLEAILFVYCFAGLAIVCDDHLVVSLETLCVRWEVREDIAGASFMAFGSAAPEIIVNAVSTIKAASKSVPGQAMTLEQKANAGEQTSLGVGAIIGSGIIAFSLIPGTCGIFAGQTLFLKRRPLLRDVTTYTTALILLYNFIDDEQIETWEACILFSIYIIYLIILATAPKCRKEYKEQQAASPAAMYERFLDEDDDMSTGKIGRTRSFVLEVQAQQAEQAKKEMRQLVEERFTEDEIFGMRRAFALFDTGNGKIATADVWRVLEVLGEEQHSAEDGEKIIACVELEDEFSVEFMEFCAAMAKKDEEDPLGEQIAEILFKPLELAFHYTCPPCEFGGPWESWYPLTFLIAFTWVSFFSMVVSAVVTRWVALLQAPMAFFGLAVVAIGAEIPDTIQSVTVAKKGYGSMAVSNGLGSQICNICVGLGMPWMLSNLGDVNIYVHAPNQIQAAAKFQFVNITINFSLLLGAALVFKQNKAELTREKGIAFLGTYVVMIIGYAIYIFS